MRDLREIFPDASVLLALAPEELAGPVLEVSHVAKQNGCFQIGDFTYPLFRAAGQTWPSASETQVELAITEALIWLLTAGFIIPDPRQQAGLYTHSRLGLEKKDRADVESYRKARLLPRDLLQPLLIHKAWNLYARGDYDTAVFQAYKEVEVAVFEASNAKGAGFTGSDFGKDLMGKAFKTDGGPLADMSRTVPERQGDLALFMGAMGHAKNPASHRNVGHDPEACAKLVLFASYLLDIVAARAQASSP